ncbi:hypothetical protein [uncultured Hymenobacter sp.]|uniref:hypothetical protein n=1 Tax=uncultured Hymenobacter sp. TaxID=170016 RepID=UPI0035CC1520
MTGAEIEQTLNEEAKNFLALHKRSAKLIILGENTFNQLLDYLAKQGRSDRFYKTGTSYQWQNMEVFCDFGSVERIELFGN